MTLTSEQKQFEEDFKRGVEEGERRTTIAIAVIAKRMLAMRNDPDFIKDAIYFYIKEMTGLSYKEIDELEDT